MPIEFRCLECNSLLRVPDNTAGKQARCGQCGVLATIPGEVEPSEQEYTPPKKESPKKGVRPPFGDPLWPLGGKTSAASTAAGPKAWRNDDDAPHVLHGDVEMEEEQLALLAVAGPAAALIALG